MGLTPGDRGRGGAADPAGLGRQHPLRGRNRITRGIATVEIHVLTPLTTPAL